VKVKYTVIAILLAVVVSTCLAINQFTIHFPMKATVSEGEAWVIEDLSLNFWSSDVMPDGTTIIATEYNTAKVYKSTDEGLTWKFIFQIPVTKFNKASLTFVDSRGNIFVSYPAEPPEIGGLWRSEDGGETFTRVWQDPVKPEANIRFDGMCEDENGVLYFGTSVGPGGPCDIYKSTDEGLTWTKISSIPRGKHIHALLFNPYNKWLYAAVGDPGYSACGLWRSKDRGLTWQKFTNLGSDPYNSDWNSWDIMSIGFYNDYVYLAIHWSRGQILRLLDNDNLEASPEEVFRSNLQLQNWLRLYQRGGKTFMLTGGENGDVGVWGSDIPPFDAGTWQEYYKDGSGGRGTACASRKISKNGWLFVANSLIGHGIRMRLIT